MCSRLRQLPATLSGEYLVYELPSDWQPLPQHLDFPGTVVAQWADSDVIERLFGAEPKLRPTFLRYLKQGSVGLVFSAGESWIACAWMSRPGVSRPPHLPRVAGATQVYWLYYNHTREDHRGKGYHKKAIALCAQWARHQDPQARVLVDTQAENLPSRRNMLAVGFEPRGVIRTYRLAVPKVPELGSLVWGSWQPSAAHPPLA